MDKEMALRIVKDNPPELVADMLVEYAETIANLQARNTGMLSATQIAAFKEAFGALAEARESLLRSDNKFASVWRQLQHT